MKDSLDKSQAVIEQPKSAYNFATINLLVAFAIIAMVGFYILASKTDSPEFTSGSSYGASAAAKSKDTLSDKAGAGGITFSTTNYQVHYFRDNKEVGQILIITGMVRNSYPEARSFIKLRGTLYDSGGKVLADRFIYAGNILTENELANLPILEIQSILNTRTGRSGLNVDIQPNAEVPFMLVFDKIPTDRESYSIDTVASEPAK